MTEAINTTAPKRVLSGMRPTGKLHLGNYMGALKNWVELQNAVNDDGSAKYECFFFIADWHALTTDYADPSRMLSNIFEITLDFLAAGLDPAKSTIFVQSHVPQHAELNLLFGMFTPLGLLERVPTYKDQQEELRDKDLATYGFLGYPLLQSADILLYQPHFVPVGQDQVAHVELTREVARKFNYLYSPKRLVLGEDGTGTEEPDPERNILPEPSVLLTPSPKLPGIDGRKMSKSYGNSILMSEYPAFILEKMSRMTNGGQRNPQSLPGNPDRCPVGEMHVLFSEPEVRGFTRMGCVEATIPCSQCKRMAAGSIVVSLHDIRSKREQLERQPEQVWAVLERGAIRAAHRASETMEQVREVTGLSRTRKPVPSRSHKVISGMAYDKPQNLSEQADWWNIDQALRARNIREWWQREIVPNEVRLSPDSERVFVTRNKKRVYVTTSREEPLRSWRFIAKAKTYEILALLCWDTEFQLHDFVVPQIVYLTPWTAFKKAHKNEEMTFWVRRTDSVFLLELPGAAPIDITAFRGQYRPMN
jgi:tryptophanyl-tRNA synthetase